MATLAARNYNNRQQDQSSIILCETAELISARCSPREGLQRSITTASLLYYAAFVARDCLNPTKSPEGAQCNEATEDLQRKARPEGTRPFST